MHPTSQRYNTGKQILSIFCCFSIESRTSEGVRGQVPFENLDDQQWALTESWNMTAIC